LDEVLGSFAEVIGGGNYWLQWFLPVQLMRTRFTGNSV
jgi:hypothetical protein